MAAMLKNALDGLVDENTLTTAQESAILDALTASQPGDQGGGQPPARGSPPKLSDGQTQRPDMSSAFSSVLDTLVADGTITSAQRRAVLDALKAVMPEPGAAPSAA